MFSFHVEYDGKRKVFKGITPSTLVKNLLTDAASCFELDPNSCRLLYKNKAIEVSQPVRFCSIPNHSTIFLEVIEQSKQSLSDHCKVAISVIPISVDSDFSLAAKTVNSTKEVDKGANLLVDKFPCSLTFAEVLQIFANRQQLPSNILSCELTLQYLCSSIPDISKTSLASMGFAGQAIRLQLLFKTPKESDESHQSQLKSNLNENLSVPPPLVAQPLTEVPSERPINKSLSPSEAIDNLLASNFDAASKPCILTLAKYIQNLRQDPSNPKVRSIKDSNKIFIDRVQPLRGHKEVLISFGFRYLNGQYEFFGGDASSSVLDDAFIALNKAMDILQIDHADRPQKRTSTLISNVAPPPEFDPYKSVRISTVSQPLRSSSESGVTQHLRVLEDRRRELEGLPSDVERNTTVVFYSDMLVKNSASSGSSDAKEEEQEAQVVEKVSLSNIIFQRIKGREDSDGAPLTTQAWRELQMAQKELVYNRCLISVRFPDRVEISAYFHPRNEVADIYEWLAFECINPQILNNQAGLGMNRIKGITTIFEQAFKLYISPPKQELVPFVSRDGHSVSSSLSDIKLVPAAKINLLWNRDIEALFATQGQYLQQQLQDTAHHIPITAKSKILNIPIGVPLISKN